MKTKEKKIKTLIQLKHLGTIKDNISKEIQDMSFEQLQVWLEKNKPAIKAYIEAKLNS